MIIVQPMFALRSLFRPKVSLVLALAFSSVGAAACSSKTEPMTPDEPSTQASAAAEEAPVEKPPIRISPLSFCAT